MHTTCYLISYQTPEIGREWIHTHHVYTNKGEPAVMPRNGLLTKDPLSKIVHWNLLNNTGLCIQVGDTCIQLPEPEVVALQKTF